jgi:hypothetical protein
MKFVVKSSLPVGDRPFDCMPYIGRVVERPEDAGLPHVHGCACRVEPLGSWRDLPSVEAIAMAEDIRVAAELAGLRIDKIENRPGNLGMTAALALAVQLDRLRKARSGTK